jgi:peptide/nickel transport system permease protein
VACQHHLVNTYASFGFIAITLALGKGFWQVFVAVGLTMWVEVARVVRGQVISVKEMQCNCCKSIGFWDFRIIFNHILPNMAPIIVISAANFALLRF